MNVVINVAYKNIICMNQTPYLLPVIPYPNAFNKKI